MGVPGTGLVERLRDRHAAVRARIDTAAARAGRDPRDIRLVAVSKTMPPEVLRAAVAAGLTTLGENRVQEAEAKAPEVPGVAAWHLIGGLQSNKVARAIALFDLIQTVDTLALAQRIARLAQARPPGADPVRVLLQVNVDADPAKGGFPPDALRAGLASLLELSNLRIAGLMTVGRLVDDPAQARPTFVALRRLSEELRGASGALGPELSMGMSDDFEVAVEEGATMVRVGRALFGERPRPA